MNNKIIKITPEGIAYDFAGNPNSHVGHKDGKGTLAKFDTPKYMAIDTRDTIYVTEAGTGAIRKVAPDGTVTTFAGNKGHIIKDGPLSIAAFRSPEFITIDKKKNIYVTDKGIDEKQNEYFVIRKISPQGEVTTLTDHNGQSMHSDFCGLVCDDLGNIIVCDQGSRCIKKITTDGSVTVLAGQCGKRFYNPVYKEGDIKTAELMTPLDIVFNKNGELYFSDLRLHRIIKIANEKVTTVAGNSAIDMQHSNIMGYAEAGYQDGIAKKALFNFPQSIAFDSKGNLFIVDQGNQCIRKLSPEGMVTTFYK
ncbi:MAG TPA: hypothetical protein VHD35_14025 [Chitinophagaceae bacterium]|nr:hypothetical protein [Chitinophagaceae bacterium]